MMYSVRRLEDAVEIAHPDPVNLISLTVSFSIIRSKEILSPHSGLCPSA